MSYTYGSQPPPTSPLGGPVDDGRNRLVQALMQIQQPPGGMASPGIPGLSDLGQPDLLGGAAAPAGVAMPGAGAMPGQGVGLPGAPPLPGQLPQSMAPQNVMGGSGAPALPYPPRQGV
jgi:hypothetical protein